MATCKDCVHVGVCKFKDLPAPLSDSYIRESECIEKRCGDFKDRSRFVELPCKLRDHIYVPTRSFISEYEISCFHIGKQGMWFDSDVIDGISTRLRNGDFDDIGKTVFLTYEEAEQALKEREKYEEI
jgi:hypothetical protein